MARPPHEFRDSTLTVFYRAGYGFTNSEPRTVRVYDRKWAGTNTPGYPNVKPLPWRGHDSKVSFVAHNLGYVYRTKRPTAGPTDWDEYWFSGKSNVSRPSGAPSEYDLYHDGSAYNRALALAMDNVKGQKSNFAQVVAERQQTTRLITDTVNRLSKAINGVRSGNFKQVSDSLGISINPRKMSKNAAKDWLALQYGWKPLLGDVKGLAEHLARNHMARPLRIRAVGIAGGRIPERVVNHRQTDYGDFQWVYGESTTTAKVILEYEVSNDFIRQGSQLGITDPLTLGWELLPWSFVVDWFIPVGDFLSRLNYDSGLTYVKGGFVYFSENTGSLRAKGGTVDFPTLKCALTPGDLIRSKNRWLSRAALPSPPRPSLPRFEDPFTPVRALNALALFRAQFR